MSTRCCVSSSYVDTLIVNTQKAWLKLLVRLEALFGNAAKLRRIAIPSISKHPLISLPTATQQEDSP